MMRSLWSGVSGLQTHQIAMDVEGNNIANVNTNGFKYSRADFGTMFSQTVKIATVPTDGRGGQNPLQIGLGASVSSTTRIHSQGSVQTTDKNTDVAINGDGFFMVSDDGGLTNYLTRNGDFKLDAYGNFVNNTGFIVQGWNINWADQTIDSSRIPGNIFIDPGMHIPAQKSTEVSIKANLNSGLNIGTSSRNLYALDSVHGYNSKTLQDRDENDTGITQFYTTSNNSIEVTEKGVDAASLFNSSGTGLNLREGQGIWVSYTDAKYSTNPNDTAAFDPNNQATQNGVIFWGSADTATTLDITLNGVRIQNDSIRSIQDAIAYINTFTAPTDTRAGTGVKAVAKANGAGIEFVNDNADGTTDNMKNIRLNVNAGNTAGEARDMTWGAATSSFTASVTPNPNPAAGATSWIDGAMNVEIITAHKYIYTSTPTDIGVMYNPDSGKTFTPNGGAGNYQRPDPANDPEGAAYWDAMNGGLLNTNARVFRTTEDLRELFQRDARYGVDYDGSGDFALDDVNEAVKVVVNASGSYAISNANEISNLPAGIQQAANAPTPVNAKNMSFNITSYTDEQGTVSTNDLFTQIFKAFDGPQPAGSQIKESEVLKLSAFSAGLLVYDSLGGRHTLEVQFVKQTTTRDGGNEWQMIIRVPEPAEINTTGEGPTNIVVGSARFNNDGSLASYSPRTVNFSPNNGAAPNQLIKLSFGTSGSNDGIVSSNSASTLTGQATDGYTSGNLKPDALRVDEKGNILGEFTNGLTFAVAKIAMASVSNNSGLEEIGGNLFKITANSGAIVVGEAGTGGRGEMKTSALEMSNTDLSRALTELIIIQRGYQANSKTISTSDQLLNTLIQLKQ
ncbi:flagellar hook protein FlgE [Campylobacter cuniculorum]|uniref:Flagellar hook protein FlgE n=2 Tax=Campylobacter cuniculorum TaxID=374106 RepID=A0A1W6BVB6_9BACT|nr:flagellar hook protein FlgE [Campylobacter cuniculorum]ARJ56032.1 flagellar hook protein, epsilonproteobacterial variant [Campylobacter cuniculorum DSM 23162 = LMG 24588]QOR05252.1 flagellar hook protein FlgE [Campylobacter cuniculorum]